ncbi:hypothetical protein FLW53_23405 [Microbispora sp. SCL1-1]|uniref:RyR domain-containing protein n=1 Tax=unclassified Microbispora TaxID=2614687 RepID=UPI001157D2F2|nr:MULTISPECIES: RyR domain-containing protein [unclassified Microbispora]NJP27092.1 hypothetical protein [Microbispora sp. CL1-1]TQS11438.1 hypothetical protein FLW53_23405 [Microbispora sp. SCL1-1]
MTPEQAAEKAAETLAKAAEYAQIPDVAGAYVGIADGWTRLCAALAHSSSSRPLTFSVPEVKVGSYAALRRDLERSLRQPAIKTERFALPVEDVARICHEANRALQLATGDPAPSPAWDEAPEWQRASAIAGVEEARGGATPEELHEAWCEAKWATGWTYGEAKDDEAKTHPCLVPYADLPSEQRAKDELFRAIVTALS